MLEEKRTGGNRNNGEIVSLDELVPKFHLLRKIDRAIDWRKIYPIVEDKYRQLNGCLPMLKKSMPCDIRHTEV